MEFHARWRSRSIVVGDVSRRVAVVEIQQPTEPLSALYRTRDATFIGGRGDELGIQTLMVSLPVIVLGKALVSLRTSKARRLQDERAHSP